MGYFPTLTAGPGWRGSSHSATSDRLDLLTGPHAPWPSTATSNTRSTRSTGSRCRRSSAPQLAGKVFLVKGPDRCISVYPEPDLCGDDERSPRRAQPDVARGARDQRVLSRQRGRRRARLGGPRDASRRLHRELAGIDRQVDRGRARATASSSGTATPGQPTTPTSRRARLSSPLHLAILLDMPTQHVPVLAGELIEALDPQLGPGRRRLHARRGRPRAPRRGPPRARRAARRHRPRPARRGGVRRARRRGVLPHALPARRLRRTASRRCSTRASRPTSSTSTSGCPRCRSTRASAASPTPTTPRWTCGWTRRRS